MKTEVNDIVLIKFEFSFGFLFFWFGQECFKNDAMHFMLSHVKRTVIFVPLAVMLRDEKNQVMVV